MRIRTKVAASTASTSIVKPANASAGALVISGRFAGDPSGWSRYGGVRIS
jgi:hypothetical protein